MYKLILLIIIIFYSCLPIFSAGTNEIIPANISGNIDFFEGDVSINDKPAEFGLKVINGDIVETGEDSFCEIIFNRGNIFRMESDTIITINWSESSLELKKGSIGAVFDKLSKVIGINNNFKIITPTAVAGIRGTAFYIRVENDQNTYICTCNGSLELYIDGSESFISSSEHHKAFKFTKSGTDVLVESAPMIYHNDSAMKEIAGSIDVTIPWSLKSN